MIEGLDHVQVAAPPGCESAARRFYGELLGMPELPKPPALGDRGGVWFRAGAQQLHVGVDVSFAPARKAHPAFLISAGGLDSLATRLQAAGARLTWDDAIDGVRRCFADDPFGNRLELLER